EARALVNRRHVWGAGAAGRSDVDAAAVVLLERERVATIASEPLPPVAAGSLHPLGVTGGSVFQARPRMNEPAGHPLAVFRVSASVKNVLVPHVVQFLAGWNELFAGMEIEQGQVLAVLLDQAVRVGRRPALLLDQALAQSCEVEVPNDGWHGKVLVHEG